MIKYRWYYFLLHHSWPCGWWSEMPCNELIWWAVHKEGRRHCTHCHSGSTSVWALCSIPNTPRLPKGQIKLKIHHHSSLPFGGAQLSTTYLTTIERALHRSQANTGTNYLHLPSWVYRTLPFWHSKNTASRRLGFCIGLFTSWHSELGHFTSRTPANHWVSCQYRDISGWSEVVRSYHRQWNHYSTEDITTFFSSPLKRTTTFSLFTFCARVNAREKLNTALLTSSRSSSPRIQHNNCDRALPSKLSIGSWTIHIPHCMPSTISLQALEEHSTFTSWSTFNRPYTERMTAPLILKRSWPAVRSASVI